MLKGLERGEDINIIYLDFAKDFDKVDSGVVLKKLKSLDIRGKLGRWIHCFLTGRKQRVVVGTQEYSKTSEVMPMITLFISLIRLKVEYGCQIWIPIQKQEIGEIEMVQG